MLLELCKAGRSKTFLQFAHASESQANQYAQGAQAELPEGLLRILEKGYVDGFRLAV